MFTSLKLVIFSSIFGMVHAGCAAAEAPRIPATLGRIAIIGPEIDPLLQLPETQHLPISDWFRSPIREYLTRSLRENRRIELVDVAPDEVAASLADAMRETGITDFTNPRTGKFDRARYAGCLRRVAERLRVDGVLAFRLVRSTAYQSNVGFAVWDGTSQSLIPGTGEEEVRDNWVLRQGGISPSAYAAASLCGELVTAKHGAVWQGQGGWNLLELGPDHHRAQVPDLMTRSQKRRDHSISLTLKSLVELLGG